MKNLVDIFLILLRFSSSYVHSPKAASHLQKHLPRYYRGCLSTLILSILTISRMTLSKGSFSDILRNDYLDHFDTLGENFDF